MAQHDDAPLADVLAEVVADTDTKAVFRRLLQDALNELIESELSGVIGAERHERTDTRTNQRNGGRPKTLSTPAGDVELRIPKVKAGSFFPSLLEQRPDRQAVHFRSARPWPGGGLVVGRTAPTPTCLRSLA